jgi:hypothetical protein
MVAVSSEGAAKEPEVSVQINSDPTGAEIEIDGKFVGNTPSSIPLSPGPHVISISKKNFQPWSKTFHVTKGASQNLNISLEKAETPK